MANVYSGQPNCVYVEDALVYGEVDGVNTVFYLEHNYEPGTLCVWLNGIRLTPGEDYFESGTAQFTMIEPPWPGWPYSPYPYYGTYDEGTDVLVATYFYEYAVYCGHPHWERNEVPEGPINNVNTDFNTKYSFATVEVYLNGVRLRPGADFVIIGDNSFRLMQAPLSDFNTTDRLLVDYIKSDPA